MEAESALRRRALPFAPEAKLELAALTGALLVSPLLSVMLPGWASASLLGLCGLLWAGSAFFFRDPARFSPSDPEFYLAPADGRVLEAQLVDEPLFIEGRACRIAIFMSMLDVHVNRAPCPGRVQWIRHIPGSHLQAFRSEAAHLNEQNLIALQQGQRRLLIKQVAGILARRIACSVRPGQQLAQGERLGIIKLGSRVELFLPPTSQILVQPGDRVLAGLTPVARSTTS